MLKYNLLQSTKVYTLSKIDELKPLVMAFLGDCATQQSLNDKSQATIILSGIERRLNREHRESLSVA